jgi:hypothetical protein
LWRRGSGREARPIKSSFRKRDLILSEREQSIVRAIAEARGDLRRAADLLSIPRRELYALVRRRPELAISAQDAIDFAVMEAKSRLIKAIFSNNVRRREWAAEWMLTNWGWRPNP